MSTSIYKSEDLKRKGKRIKVKTEQVWNDQADILVTITELLRFLNRTVTGIILQIFFSKEIEIKRKKGKFRPVQWRTVGGVEGCIYYF